ncbi:MAG: YebC/PmpR family DNA-binding transcriptional regulator [Candidatus Muiribacterium halophilum]|uniref:Probable transcriptional regulatory protein C0601_07655 n=1 Tax=Muiribacterium halophilum TaxID=2053465 RepID=A0A2N5ZFF8_MUIH1|nr:MAG: YebC/PmpR family DNA-binding transcriptional regulator [Candidatus Muirbacterium halophilum]
MSGHNKWSTIKHKKGAKDAKKGKIFSKMAKIIYLAAREGGTDEDKNAKLRMAIQKAKSVSMPNDNIKRALKRAEGGTDGEEYTEIIYEGYGPEGVAMLVQCLTDNKNRTAASVRHIFSKYGGNLGEAGCVGWMFDRKGYITVSKEDTDEDSLMEIVLEAGAEDIKTDDESVFEIISEADDYETVNNALEKAGIKIDSSDITMIPQNYVKLDENGAKKLMRLMDMLEDDDDVQEVFANFDIDDEIMERLSE